MNRHGEDESCILWCGNLNDECSEEILFELFLQAGPLVSVKKPKEKTFAFVTFKHKESVKYAIDVMDGICLFGRFVNMRHREKNNSGASRDESYDRERRDRERSPPRGRDRERYDGGRHSRDSSRNSGREVFATPKRVAGRDPWGNADNGGYTPTGAGNGGFRNFGGWDDGYGTPQDHRGRRNDRGNNYDRSYSEPQRNNRRRGDGRWPSNN